MQKFKNGLQNVIEWPYNSDMKTIYYHLYLAKNGIFLITDP